MNEAEPVEQSETPAEQIEELAADEVAEEELVQAEALVEDAFVAGLAKLTAGYVYSDKWQKEEAGTVIVDAIVYAIERVTGEGELTGNHVIRIAANIKGQAKVFFVKNNRLAYLNADQTAAYQNAKHDDGIDYKTVKLDPVSFEATAVEEVLEVIAEEPAHESIPADPDAIEAPQDNMDEVVAAEIIELAQIEGSEEPEELAQEEFADNVCEEVSKDTAEVAQTEVVDDEDEIVEEIEEPKEATEMVAAEVAYTAALTITTQPVSSEVAVGISMGVQESRDNRMESQCRCCVQGSRTAGESGSGT